MLLSGPGRTYSRHARLVVCVLLVLGARPILPMHWEEQVARGVGGPAARFGHAGTTLDFPAGMVYMYGGLAVERGNTRVLKASDDVWMFDPRSQSWEEAVQLQGAPPVPVTPRPRAFHTMTSTGEC